MTLQDVPREKIRLKLLSLLFAASLWIFVTMEGETEMELPLGVEFVNIPAGMKVSPLPKLTVTVSGARIVLLRQKIKGAVAYLDLAGAVVGRVDYSAMERYVRLEGGLRPLRVSPANVSINLENAGSTGVKQE